MEGRGERGRKRKDKGEKCALGDKGGWGNMVRQGFGVGGGGLCAGRCDEGVRREGESGQTGDARFMMTGREERRGRGRLGARGFVSTEDTQRREMGWLI